MNNEVNRNAKLFLNLALLVLLSLSITVAAQDSSDPVVIEIGNEKTTLSQFNATFNVAVRILAAQQGIALGNQDSAKIENLRKQFLGQRAGELSLVQEANRRGIKVSEEAVLAQAADYRQKIAADKTMDDPVDQVRLLELVREKQLVMGLSDQLLDEIVVRPGDVVVLHHDIQDEITRPEQICLRHILVEDETTANELITQLNNGADFATLAREKSIDSKTAQNGGDMGCFEKENMIARSDFERAAFRAAIDKLTGPVNSEFGYHVLVVYKRIAAHTPTLNDMFDELSQEIRHERLPEKLMEIRDASGERTYPDKLGEGVVY